KSSLHLFVPRWEKTKRSLLRSNRTGNARPQRQDEAILPTQLVISSSSFLTTDEPSEPNAIIDDPAIEDDPRYKEKRVGYFNFNNDTLHSDDGGVDSSDSEAGDNGTRFKYSNLDPNYWYLTPQHFQNLLPKEEWKLG